jgi:hypothetical protein
MEYINLALDIVIVLLALWVLGMLIGYGGFIGKALRLIGIGTIIIGVAQLIETATIYWLGVNTATFELIHRLLILAGFIFITWSYHKLMKKDLAQ